MPEASLVSRIGQQLGGSFGAAVLTVILEAAVATTTHVAAFEIAFWWTTGFSVFALLLSFLLPGRPKTAEAAAQKTAETAQPTSAKEVSHGA